jgi:outer membrane lipoprotein-sorting protein
VESTVHAGEGGTWVIDLRLRGAGGPERQVYLVDDTSHFLRGAETYEGDLLVSRVTYAKERLNLELSDGYFNM